MGRVLVACEHSGVVRDAFRALGHDAVSCDMLAPERPGPHRRWDVREVIRDEHWDLMIAHPPCTYLASSGLHWNRKDPERRRKTFESLQFVSMLMSAPIERIAIENPVGKIGTAIRPPDQIIQPYEFGHDASKATCLWLNNLPRLTPTDYVEPRLVDGKPRWGNQTDAGQDNTLGGKKRWAIRSRTFPGVARAMAEQWGPLLPEGPTC